MIQFASYAAVQVSMIVVFASCVCRFLLGNRSASSRHGVWLIAMLAIVVMYPASRFLPDVQLSLPRSIAVKPSAVLSESEKSECGFAPQNANPMPAVDEWSDLDAQANASRGVWIVDANQHSTSQPQAPVSQEFRFPLTSILFVIYTFGVIVAVSRMLFATIHFRRMEFSATRFDARQQFIVEQCVDQLSISCAPKVLISKFARTPLVFGIGRPTVVLPIAFLQWPLDCQRSVLLHELSHIKRRDGIWDFMSRCVTACYWFHPLVHFSLRSLRREREAATDECVIRHGVAAIQYARHLLLVLENSQSSRFFEGALAMSGFGNMTRRVQNILRMERQTPGGSWPICLATCLVFFVIGVTSLRLASAQVSRPADPVAAEPVMSDSTPEKQDTSQQLAASPHAESQGISAGEQPPQAPPHSFHDTLMSSKLASEVDHEVLISVSGTVVASDGEPAKGAVVVLRQSNAWNKSVVNKPSDLFARTFTNALGQFRFANTPVRKDTMPYQAIWEVAAASPEQVGWQTIGNSRQAHSLRIQLHESASISGVFVDPEGIPINGAHVSLDWISDPNPEDRSHRSLNDFYLHRSSLQRVTMTDRSGRFVLDGLPRGYLANVGVQHPSWAGLSACIRTSEEIPLGIRYPDIKPGQDNREVLTSGAMLPAEPGFLIFGNVRDSKGNPVAGCAVRLGGYDSSAKTDQVGRFTYRVQPDAFDHLPANVEGLNLSITTSIDSGLLGHQEILTKNQVSSGEPLDFILQDGIEISGKVVTEQGIAMAGVYVIGAPLVEGDAAKQAQALRTSSAVSMEDGHYRMLVPNEGAYRLVVWGNQPGFVLPRMGHSVEGFTSWGPTQSVRVKRGAENVVDPIVVAEAPRVLVHCIDETGQAVVGATVQLIQRLPQKDKRFSRDLEISDPATTDSSGRGTLRPPILYASDVILKAVIDHEGQHLWTESSLPADLTAGEHLVTLKRMWRLTGKVLVDDAPMRGASVMAWRQPSTQFFVGAQSMSGTPKSVDENGQYHWYVPPIGSYSVSVWSVKGFSRRVSSPSRSVYPISPYEYRAEDIEFRMAHGRISGRVIDTHGRPVAGVRLQSIPKFTSHLLLANPSPNAGRTLSHTDGSFFIDGLPEGEYYIKATAESKPMTHYPATATAHVGDSDLVVTISPVVLQPNVL